MLLYKHISQPTDVNNMCGTYILVFDWTIVQTMFLCMTYISMPLTMKINNIIEHVVTTPLSLFTSVRKGVYQM